MPLVEDEVLILRTVSTGEADLIIHLLGKERGRRTAFAKNARKSRRRFAGALEPFTCSKAQLNIRRRQPLDRMDSAEVVNSFASLRKSLVKIYLASYFCELLDALLVEGETYPEVYALMLFFLDRLSGNEASLKHRVFFELRLMSLLGYRPDFFNCGVSGKPLGERVWFDRNRLAFISDQNLADTSGAPPVSRIVREALSRSLDAPLSGLSRIRMDAATAREAAAITRVLVLANTPRELRSMKLLDSEFEE